MSKDQMSRSPGLTLTKLNCEMRYIDERVVMRYSSLWYCCMPRLSATYTKLG